MTTTPRPRVDTRVVVETPEGVDFQFVIAGPGKRAIALAIDIVIKAAVIWLGFFLMVLVGVTFSGRLIEGSAGLWLVLLFMMDWFYSSIFETLWNGQTPGKKSLNLRVVRTNGTPITAVSAIGRNFLSAADSMPRLIFGVYTVGILSMLCNRRMQRIGDLVFDTMVIDETRERISRTAGVTTDIEPIVRSQCTGRFSVPERTLAVIERLFEGDRLVSDGRREQIARPLSLSLRRVMGYEEPGPDPANPHIYFQQSPNRHTQFLLRVLKTFAEDHDDRSIRTGRAAPGGGPAGRTAGRPSGGVRRRSAAGETADDSVSLDEWLHQESRGSTQS